MGAYIWNGKCRFCRERIQHSEQDHHLAVEAHTEPRTGKKKGRKVASREERQARYLDCGPLNWDDQENPDF